MTRPPLRTALIGLGRIGMGYADDPRTSKWLRYATHAQVLSAHPAFDWGAAVDPSGDARRRASAKWNVPTVATEVGALVDRYEPEVAVIATPPGRRVAIVERLPGLRAVLVEKPLGRTLSEAEDFLAACAARSIVVQVNLWRRADERLRTLAAGRLAADIGECQAVFGVYGNGILNNGTHLIDLLAMLVGDFVRVQALPSGEMPTPGPVPGDLNLPFSAELGTGVAATVLPLDFAHYREVGIDIWGQRGRLSIMQEGLLLTTFPRAENRAAEGEREIASDRPSARPSTIGDALYHLYSNLADAVWEGTELWSSGRSALKAERVVAAVRASRRAGNTAVGCQ